MTSADADLCVIGGGEAGFSAAMAGAALALRVILVDSAETDPGWRNWDVALAVLREAGLRARRQDHRLTAETAARFQAELEAALAANAADRSFARLQAMNVRVLRGRARFVDPRTVKVGQEVIRARRFVVATGARPPGPPQSWRSAIERLRRPGLPAQVLVAGGDPRSVALAQGLCRFGIDMTLQLRGELLPGFDAELLEPLRLALGRDGVSFPNEALPDAPFHEAETDPYLADLDPERAGIRTRAGHLVLSPALRTTNHRVYAVGSAAGGMSTQAAQAQVATVMKAAFFRLPVRYDSTSVPAVAVTDPEIASIGTTEAEARANGKLTVLRWPFRETARGGWDAAPGHVKVVADQRGRILGAGIVGGNAADQIGVWTLAIRSGTTLQELSDMAVPVPSFSEASRRLILQHAAERLRSPWLRRALTLLGRLG